MAPMAAGRQAQPDRPLYLLHVALVEKERPAAGIRPDRPREAHPGATIRVQELSAPGLMRVNASRLHSRFMSGMLICLGGASVLLVAAMAAAAQSEAGATRDLRLVPFPKSVTLEAGCFSFGKSLTFEISDGQGEMPAQLLNAELQRAGLRGVRGSRLKSAVPAFRLAARKHALVLPALPEQISIESYALDVRADEIVCAAKDAAGLFCGLQTLCQLIRANRQGDTLPCLKISDWPSLRWRCFQDDMTRGPSSTLDTLKFEASLASYLKLNLMTYYMEYQFEFKKHPKIGPTNGSFTPQELSALVEYVKPLHMDVLGNQQSFGHFGQILSHPEYAPLRETPDVLTPVRDETYQLLDDLYSEVCPLVPFPWFNI